MSRTRKMLVVASVAMFAACSGEGITESVSTSTQIANAKEDASKAKPAGGRCTTAFNVIGGNATSITLAITGICNLEHLGRTSMTATQTISTVTGALANLTTYTAANGDRLQSSFVGQIISPPGPDVAFIGTETYTGGTGRFSGASGSSALNGTATLAGPSGTGAYTTSGNLKY